MSMRGYGAWLLVAAIELWSRSAHACGTSPPVRTITAIEVGAEPLPLDGAIALDITTYPWSYDSGSSPQLMVRVTRAEDGAVVAGELSTVSEQHPYWHPSALLEPNTQYAILVVTDTTPRPDLDGAVSMAAFFTTGASAAPAIALEGSLKASLRVERVDDMHCEVLSDCLDKRCDVVGTRDALFVDVELPAVSGGVEGPGYSGILRLDEDAPETFSGPGAAPLDGAIAHSLALSSDQPGHISFELLDRTHAYAPCFALNVWDIAGHWISPEPVCLPKLDVADYIAEHRRSEPRSNDGGTARSVLSHDAGASDGERAEVSLDAPSADCSIRASGPHGLRGLLVGFIALAICAGLRARRARRGR